MDEITTKEKTDIDIPRIGLDNLMLIDEGIEHLSQLYDPLKEKYMKDINELYARKEKEFRAEKGKGWYKLFRLLDTDAEWVKSWHYYRIDKKFLKKSNQEKYFPEKDEIDKKHIFSKLDIFGDDSEIQKLPNKVGNVQDEVDVFLRYIFPTLRNRSAGGKQWKEIVPVEESFRGDVWTEEFEKKGFEKFATMSEDMKLIPMNLLEEEHIKDCINRIEAATKNFNKSMGKISEDIKSLGTKEADVDKNLARDVEIANYALSGLKNTKFPEVGIFAILYNTSLEEIKKNLSNKIFKFNQKRDSILKIADYSFSDFLESRGYYIYRRWKNGPLIKALKKVD